MTEVASGGITRDNTKDCLTPGRASLGSRMILHWLAVPDKHDQGQPVPVPRKCQNEERASKKWSISTGSRSTELKSDQSEKARI
jgi:hypothetical protein